MGSYEDNKTSKARQLYILSNKIEELHRTKEELKQAKDEAMQTWLDSRPLIDELEKLQLELANAKQQSVNTVVVNLESELMAINTRIRVKKEKDLKARTKINEMTKVSEGIREEMERIRLKLTEEKRERLKMKMEIKIRRQTLRTLKLTLRAVRLESEAYGASGEAALEQLARAKVTENGVTVELTQEDYVSLARRAKKETALADWRVVVATEQRVAAEESRDMGLARLNDLINEKQKGVSTPFPKARAKEMADGEIQRNLSKRQVGKKKKKKKRSIFFEIKSFFARKMKYLFG